MKIKKILVAGFFILVTIIIATMIYNYGASNRLGLYALTHSPISIQKGDKIFFYEEGFAIAGEYTNYFDNKGDQVSFPFSLPEDAGSHEFNITATTANYMLVNGNTLYKINDLALEKVFSMDSSAIGMKEFGKYLLFVTREDTSNIKLNFLDVENGIFSDLGFDDNLYYMDADNDISDSSLSILTLDIDTPFPSSKILHYDGNLSLYGIISSVDQIYYRVFRFPSNILLIGNHQLVCYNIEGNIEWELESTNINGSQVSRNDSGLLLYFNQTIRDGSQEENFNGIFFNNKGEQQKINLPNQLSKIAPFKDQFLALHYGKNVLIIDKDGKIQQQYFLDEDARDIYWNPYEPSYFVIIKQDDTLQVYSTKQEDSFK